MLISEKQHEANQQNARHSTGPKTEEGKEAVRFNALKHGLRAEATLLPNEDAAQFDRFCTGLEDEWNPQNKTERLLVEQLAVQQWQLRRMAYGEKLVFITETLPLQEKVPLIERFEKMIGRLENSFSKTVKELTQLQKTRQAEAPAEAPQRPKAPKVHPPAPEPPPAESPSPGHVYVMQPQTP